jgi:hypothetical protein
VVIEIKGNEAMNEYSRDFLKNKSKYFETKAHFERLNNFLEKS